MDGTLVDTEPAGLEVMRDFLAKRNIILTEDEWILFDKVWRRDGTDIRFEQFLSNILLKYSPAADIRKETENFYRDYEMAILVASQLPGADELLHKFKNKFKVALVTASTASQARAVLENNSWGKVFDLVISHDDFEKSKPDPESYLTACAKLGLGPNQCFVVEDSKNGVLAGKNAGMFVIGVRAGNKHPQDITKADLIVNTLKDIQI